MGQGRDRLALSHTPFTLNIAFNQGKQDSPSFAPSIYKKADDLWC